MARFVDGGLFSSEPRSGLALRASRRSLLAFVVGCLVVLALCLPGMALAAEAKAPEAGGGLDLQAWPDSGQLIVVTAVTVPESTKLPTTVRVPVPEGATVQWAGEVLGGDLSADPAREYKMITSPAGGRYAEFTVEQTRTAQVDAAMPVLVVTGDTTSATFEWIQSVSSPFTSFSVRVPGTATDVKISPAPAGQPDTNSAGERLYTGDQLTLKPGDKQKVTMSYSTAPAGSAAPAAGGVDSLMIALLAALAVAVIVLVVVVARQRQGTAQPASQTPAAPRTRGASASAAAPKPDTKSGTASDEDWGFDDTE